MNRKINKYLLARNKCLPEMYLRHPGFNHIACWPFTKNKERIQRFKEGGDSRVIYQNKLDTACFQYEIVNGDFRDLGNR